MNRIRQIVTLPGTPHDIYEALLDSQAHTTFTGDTARMSRAVGGRFSAFSGYATGVNVELVKDRKIVQTWRASDWPKGAESTVAFSLTKSRGGKTRLTFSQAGVPDEFVKEITQGWHDNYWKPLREYLAQ